MLYLIAQMLFCLLLAFVLGVLLGWLLWYWPRRGMRDELEGARAEASNFSTRVRQLEGDIAKSTEESDRLAQAAEIARKDADDRQQQLDALAAQLAARDTDLASHRNELAPVQADLEACREQLKTWRGKSEDDTGRLGATQAELESARARVEQADAELVTLHADLARVRSELSDCLATSPAADTAAPARTLFDADAVETSSPVAAAVGLPARADDRDDLREIYGVGRVLEGWLHGFGIFTFRQIALWNDKDIDAMDDLLEHFTGRIRRDVWPEQARRLHNDKYGEDPVR